MIPRALHLQEVCYTIADFLRASPDDLRSCALVSPLFTAAAQRLLFHDIIFNRRCKTIDDLGLLPQYDESEACLRFCAVLKTSPHLIPLVRRIRIGLGHKAGTALSAIKFPNLRELVLHGRLRALGADIDHSPAAGFLRAPSLRRVGLVYPIFHSLGDLYRLVAAVNPSVVSLSLQRVLVEDGHVDRSTDYSPLKIKALRLHRLYMHHPECLEPFDLSQLEELDYGDSLTPKLLHILEDARESISRLVVNAEQVVQALPTLLSGLPVLADLTIVSDSGSHADIEMLLQSLSSDSCLERLTLKLGVLDVEGARHIGRASANSARVVTVYLKTSSLPPDVGEHLEAIVHSTFVQLDDTGVFEMLRC